MEKIIKNQTFGQERALYGSENIKLVGVAFDGEEDGESALKECKSVVAQNCFFNLRYPLWHDSGATLTDCEMTENCRAALWYCGDVIIKNSKLFGIKAVRECNNVRVDGCKIVSPEFGWRTNKISFNNCTVQSEYFLLFASEVSLNDTAFTGKYSFQYVQGGVVENCTLNTKDAFWHAKGVRIKNCKVSGEYLAWYSEDLVFENCEIYGTQPFCYCKNLTLINCSMHGCDLAFEKSEVNATVTTKIDSVKNPYVGKVCAPEIGEIILTDKNAKAKIEIV